MSVASCPLATLSLAYADYDLSASLLILSILWIVWLIFSYSPSLFFFFLNDPAPPEIYPLSLPDALPIFSSRDRSRPSQSPRRWISRRLPWAGRCASRYSISPAANCARIIAAAARGCVAPALADALKIGRAHV